MVFTVPVFAVPVINSSAHIAGYCVNTTYTGHALLSSSDFICSILPVHADFGTSLFCHFVDLTQKCYSVTLVTIHKSVCLIHPNGESPVL